MSPKVYITYTFPIDFLQNDFKSFKLVLLKVLNRWPSKPKYFVRSLICIRSILIVNICRRLNLVFILRIIVFSSRFSLLIIWLLGGGVAICLLTSSIKGSFLWWRVLLTILISFSSPDLFIFYIFFELRLVPILIIILYWGNQPERLSAGLYFLLYTSVISFPYLFFLLGLFPSSYSFETRKLEERALLSFLLLLPFLVKIPIFGLHFWLPKAHVEARTRGSIVLAGLLLKLGSYGVFQILKISKRLFLKTWIPFWVFRAIFCRMLTCIQSDLKKLVAYSSVSHITFIIVGGSSSTVFLSRSLAFLSLAHGWTSIGLFLIAGILRQSFGSRVGFLVFSPRKISLFIILSGIFLVRNASIPPLPSFFPELFIVIGLSKVVQIFMVITFIILRILVCFFNCIFFIRIRQKGPLERISNISVYTEILILKIIRSLLFLSILWLRIL